MSMIEGVSTTPSVIKLTRVNAQGPTRVILVILTQLTVFIEVLA